MYNGQQFLWFFIIMGRFCLFEHRSKKMRILPEDNKPLHPLKASNLWMSDSYKPFFMLTKVEIKDRGKSDLPAKSLILLQILWFVMQCIAHAIKHLPVTHLEIIMLAYAAMNFVIYIFWWNKPLNVNQPVQAFQKSKSGEILEKFSPMSINQSLRHRNQLWRKLAKAWKRYFTLVSYCRFSGWLC